MFFTKNPSFSPNSGLNCVVIGFSPLALFITDILLNQGHKTTLLVPQNKLDYYTKLNPFTVKTSSFQSKRTDVPFASSLNAPADFCFIASSPASSRIDILLLQTPMLKDTPLINLSSFYNQRILKELKKDFFSGWLNSWLNLEKNTIHLLERNPKLEIHCPSDLGADITSLFAKNSADMSLSITKSDMFWTRFIPFFLSNLILLASNQSISLALTQQHYRQLVDGAIKELETLTHLTEKRLNTSDILPQIYTTPDNYKSEFSSPESFSVLSSLLGNISPASMPNLNNLFMSAVKNIRV